MSLNPFERKQPTHPVTYVADGYDPTIDEIPVVGTGCFWLPIAIGLVLFVAGGLTWQWWATRQAAAVSVTPTVEVTLTETATLTPTVTETPTPTASLTPSLSPTSLPTRSSSTTPTPSPSPTLDSFNATLTAYASSLPPQALAVSSPFPTRAPDAQPVAGRPSNNAGVISRGRPAAAEPQTIVITAPPQVIREVVEQAVIVVVTATPTVTETPTATLTATSSATATETPTVTATATPSATATETPTVTATVTPSATATETPSPTSIPTEGVSTP
jgi:hypothetical protein